MISSAISARVYSGGRFNRALMTVAQVIRDPGSLVADLIRDNLGGVAGRLVGGVIRGIVNNLVAAQINRLPLELETLSILQLISQPTSPISKFVPPWNLGKLTQ